MDSIQEKYEKLIENELSRTEEEKSDRDKFAKENKNRKKFYEVKIFETPENIIKIMNILMKEGKNEKT